MDSTWWIDQGQGMADTLAADLSQLSSLSAARQRFTSSGDDNENASA